ncbi:putative maltose permease [Lineolata rhizophorae]|uniref:Putative maltose permease n=1 Tax=Lineolata rhizophorae TaxID=578093 RepID=A0A6A6PE83_9PEZI|nr:putative maltose permease [Lineolata rhizophorae]
MARQKPMNESFRKNWKCLLACTMISMCPFQYGLDFGLIGGLQAMPGFLMVFGHRDPSLPLGWNLSHERQQLISSLMTLGAFITSSTAGFSAVILSRRQCIWAASALCIVSNIVMMTTDNMAGLYSGRLLLGFANGYFMTFSQLYIQESSPARFRGFLLAGFQFWTSFGSLIGTIVDNFTAKIMGREAYLIPLGIIYIVPVLMSIGIIFVPESPRWLVQHGTMEKARASLLWLRPDKDAVDGELAEIKAALEAEERMARGVGFLDCFRNPIDRRRTIVAVAGVSTQAASGAMFMIAYGTYFFEMAHVGNAFENSCILNGVGVAAILINQAVVTHVGRRRVFLMIGMAICGFCQLIVAVVYDKEPGTVSTGKVIVGLGVLYIVGYNGMVSTYAWLTGGEIPSQRLRSYTFGMAASLGFLGAWLATFTAPYFINPDSLDWGPRYGYIWFPSCMVTVVWIYFFLPEVKGRSLEEIDEMVSETLFILCFLFCCSLRRNANGARNSSRRICRRASSASTSASATCT